MIRSASISPPSDRHRPWNGGIVCTGFLSSALRCLNAAAAEDPTATTVAPGTSLQELPSIGSLTQVTLSLLAVILLIVLVAWILRRLARIQVAAGGTLRVIGGLSVGTRERVVLIEAGKFQVLLGVAPGRVQTLHVFEGPLEVRAPEPGPGVDFTQRLQDVLQPGKRS